MFRSIVVGTDGSETAHKAVGAAIELARLTGAQLELVSAYEPPTWQRTLAGSRSGPGDPRWTVAPREDVDATLAEAAARAQAAAIGSRSFAREGDPADAILDVAEELNADLIVVGSKGTTGAERFLLGSVPDKVTHHAPCAVMIIRTN
ncbi:MAG TPA: universal stress protein [Solirubrobacteraceae bacterium]|nr:universal stress protein [Solirubrobacteraceae bacterium]